MVAGCQRLDIHRVDPQAYQAVFAMESYVRNSGLDPRLYELVTIRASQLNGSTFRLDMHNRDARKSGEDPATPRHAVGVARTPRELFTDTERAALAFTETVTRIGDAGVPGSVWIEPSDPAGFDADEAEVVFWGTCPNCLSSPGISVQSTHHNEEITR